MTTGLQALSDEELARRTQAGSLLAFEELVHRYGDRVYGFVARACGRCDDPQEVTQQTFVRAFQSITQFDSRREFAPWLFTLARRISIDRHRRQLPVADKPPPEQVDHADPSELLAQREERRDLWQLARRRLPGIQFQALWLCYAEEMNVVQIAHVLGKARTHVKVLLFRARQTLAGALAGEPQSRRTESAQRKMPIETKPLSPLVPRREREKSGTSSKFANKTDYCGIKSHSSSTSP
jgi:RNA polymerase sigma-70 factor (ECF subfamily)